MNQNVSATKRKRFVTFATSIVDNLCLLYTAISRKVVGKRHMRQSRKAMDVSLQMLKESDKSRFDSYSARNSALSISCTTFQDCQVHIFSNNLSRTAVHRLQNSPYFCVFKYGRAVKQNVWNEAENIERDWGERAQDFYATLSRFLNWFWEKNRLFCSLAVHGTQWKYDCCAD